jgi:uncharacterized protein
LWSGGGENIILVMRAPIDNGIVLLTGASSGIGRAFAVQLGPRVKALALVARRKDRLELLAEQLKAANPNLEVLVQSCDLSDLNAVDEMLAAVEERLGPLDILINNAGMANFGLFEKSSWDRVHLMIQVNITALTYLARRVVVGMVNRGRGGILNVSSGFGLSVIPGVSTYAATKHYVTALTEVLRMELKGTDVVISQLCPGPVLTELETSAENKTGVTAPSFVYMSPERCARLALRGFSRGRALILPGFVIRFLLFFNGLSPRWLLRLVYWPAAAMLRRNQQA